LAPRRRTGPRPSKASDMTGNARFATFPRHENICPLSVTSATLLAIRSRVQPRQGQEGDEGVDAFVLNSLLCDLRIHSRHAPLRAFGAVVPGWATVSSCAARERGKYLFRMGSPSLGIFLTDIDVPEGLIEPHLLSAYHGSLELFVHLHMR